MARHSRVNTSRRVNVRNRFPLKSASDTKSIDHTSLGCCGGGCAARRAALTWRRGRFIRAPQARQLVQPKETLVVDVPALTSHQYVNPPVPIPNSGVPDLGHPFQEKLLL